MTKNVKQAEAIVNDSSRASTSPDPTSPDVLAWQYEAGHEAVDYVLTQDIHADGRSPWTWLRLANGDLALAVFPRGETYEHVSETDAVCEYPALDDTGKRYVEEADFIVRATLTTGNAMGTVSESVWQALEAEGWTIEFAAERTP